MECFEKREKEKNNIYEQRTNMIKNNQIWKRNKMH